MTHEEMERTMEFILNQQARFSVDIDLLKESQARMSADIASLIELSRRGMETADADRRLMREMVQDLKDVIYRVESKADEALRKTRNKDVGE
ncbi:MAG TPA: hypothetical protein PLL06_10250 [Acidobacteriota bacterium]|nr:hypothetical protein [Acidobacteriota bacterium]HNG94481.1 hypothetical protein [Acidobacteriota bacterium]HNJ41681.1 hypothetical protein [Acidobacteriota bacterium]